MKIITHLACSALLTSLAFFVGCERHSLAETKALHQPHGDHGHGHGHDSHAKDDSHAKTEAAVQPEKKEARKAAPTKEAESVEKGKPRSIGL